MASDRYLGLGIIAVAIFYLISSLQIPTGFLADPVGSKTFPFIVGGISLICGILIFLRPDPSPTWPELTTLMKIALAMVVMFFFAVSLRPLGFIIPSALASSALSYMITPVIWQSVVTGAGLSVGLYFILKYGLGLGLVAFGKMIPFLGG